MGGIISDNIMLVHKEWNETNVPTRNIDWFFTYLKRNRVLNLMTFYFDNTVFCHLGYLPIEFQAGSVIHIFENNQMNYLCDYEDERHYPRNIQPDNIKIDLGTDKILYTYHEKYVARLKYKEMESMVYNLSEKIKQYESKLTVIDKILDSVKERGLRQTAGICFRKIVGKVKGKN